MSPNPILCDEYLLCTYHIPRTLLVTEHIADSSIENSQISLVFSKLMSGDEWPYEKKIQGGWAECQGRDAILNRVERSKIFKKWSNKTPLRK